MSAKGVVCITIPVLFAGGTEIQTINLARVLVRARYDVTVCCFYESDTRIITALEQTGARLEFLREKWSNGLWQLFKRLVKFFRHRRPDIVHVQYVAPGLIPILAAKIAGIKRIFATVHQPGRIYGLKAKLLIRIAAYLCDAFFCNSKSVEESWFGNSELFDPDKNNKKRKHFTIYNGVYVDRIAKIVKNADNEKIKQSLNIKDKRIIGSVGRLREEKGLFKLLQSMKQVIKDVPNAVLLVVGDGPDRAYLEQSAIRLGVSDHVLWLGQKDPDEVFELYGIMDLVVVPSLFEGFSLTAAEAMAAGRPVVASKVDGLIEVVQNGLTGLLVRPGDSEALGQGIIELLLNPEKAASMSNMGRKVVEDQFSLVRFQTRFLAALNRFIEGKEIVSV